MQSSVFSSATVPVSGQTPKPKEMSKATNHWLCHPSDIRNPYSIWELQLQPTATPIYTETRCNRWTAVGSHCIRSAAALLPALVNFPIARLECPLGGSLISGHFCTITWNIGRRFDRTRNIQSESCSFILSGSFFSGFLYEQLRTEEPLQSRYNNMGGLDNPQMK